MWLISLGCEVTAVFAVVTLYKGTVDHDNPSKLKLVLLYAMSTALLFLSSFITVSCGTSTVAALRVGKTALLLLSICFDGTWIDFCMSIYRYSAARCIVYLRWLCISNRKRSSSARALICRWTVRHVSYNLPFLFIVFYF